MEEYNPVFTASIEYDGIVYATGKSGHLIEKFEHPIGEIFSDFPDPRVRVIDRDTVQLDVSGYYKGVCGANLLVKSEQFKLDGTPVAVVQAPLSVKENSRTKLTESRPDHGVQLFDLDDDGGMGVPNGIFYEILGNREVGQAAPGQCGFNDLSVPNTGIFQIETRSYKEYANGQIIRSWSEEVAVFVRCQVY
jgi:hypothetical protein